MKNKTNHQQDDLPPLLDINTWMLTVDGKDISVDTHAPKGIEDYMRRKKKIKNGKMYRASLMIN